MYGPARLVDTFMIETNIISNARSLTPNGQIVRLEGAPGASDVVDIERHRSRWRQPLYREQADDSHRVLRFKSDDE